MRYPTTRMRVAAVERCGKVTLVVPPRPPSFSLVALIIILFINNEGCMIWCRNRAGRPVGRGLVESPAGGRRQITNRFWPPILGHLTLESAERRKTSQIFSIQEIIWRKLRRIGAIRLFGECRSQPGPKIRRDHKSGSQLGFGREAAWGSPVPGLETKTKGGP